ncbi:MAG: HepT-like ribonuclease domain-containing protein [Chloroflexota bacterium]
MKTTLKKRLLDALNACRAIQSFVANRTFAEYERNLMLRSAVERQFEIIGEALSQAENDNPDLSTLIPDVRRIVGMRNRIIHGYDSVDDELLWQTIQSHIPPLAQRLTELLESGAD